jgi:rhamnogalacturonan acetylesterase
MVIRADSRYSRLKFKASGFWTSYLCPSLRNRVFRSRPLTHPESAVDWQTMNARPWIILCRLLLLVMMAGGWARAAAPAIYLVGDSTVRTTQEGKAGWGDALMPWLSPNPPRVENQARGGASSRSFQEGGWWKKTLDALRPGDLVLIQFGHNDQGSPKDGKASLPGIGDEAARLKTKKGKEFTVRTYGHYLGAMVAEAKAKGAIPVIVTPVPRNLWDGEKIDPRRQPHVAWAKELAAQTGTPLIDLHALVCQEYEKAGRIRVSKHYFQRGDESHTTREGASVSAKLVATALREHSDPAVRQASGGK